MWLEKFFQIIDESFVGKFIDKRLDIIKITDPNRIYVENIRSFFNISTLFAEYFCEMAVKENLFVKQYGVECPKCNKLLSHYNSRKEIPEKFICEHCLLLEEDKYKYEKSEVSEIVFYQLNRFNK